MSVPEARFVSLAEALLTPLGRLAPAPAAPIQPFTSAPPQPLVEAPPQPLVDAPSQSFAEIAPECAPPDVACGAPAAPLSHEPRSAVRAARLFRAALGDAFDALLVDLVHRLSAEILGRELHLSVADITPIAQRLIAERLADEPLRIRVAPADVGIACTLPVVPDPSLVLGDAVLECRTGGIDARLGIRLTQLIAELCA